MRADQNSACCFPSKLQPMYPKALSKFALRPLQAIMCRESANESVELG